MLRYFLEDYFMKFIKDMADWCAFHGAYTVTILAMLISAYLAVMKDADINSLLPTLIGLFLTHTASRAISSHWAASKDKDCNTADILKIIEGSSPDKK